jgi:hypothetical protein
MKGDRIYSFKPVEQLLIARLGDQVLGGQAIVKPGTPMFAEFLGEHRRQVARWRSSGVSRSLADRIADRLGLHVYEIWPEMRDDDIEDLEAKVRAAAAARKRRQYAHRRDEILKRNRRYRQEAARAIQVQRRRRYRENAEIERARSRAYYEANRERMKEAARRRRSEAA